MSYMAYMKYFVSLWQICVISYMKYRIKEICKEKGIYLEQLASAIGTSQASISRIITGKGNPTIETLERIAKALDVSVFDLMGDTSEKVAGYVEYKGIIYRVNSFEDLEKVLRLRGK